MSYPSEVITAKGNKHTDTPKRIKRNELKDQNETRTRSLTPDGSSRDVSQRPEVKTRNSNLVVLRELKAKNSAYDGDLDQSLLRRHHSLESIHRPFSAEGHTPHSTSLATGLGAQAHSTDKEYSAACQASTSAFSSKASLSSGTDTAKRNLVTAPRRRELKRKPDGSETMFKRIFHASEDSIARSSTFLPRQDYFNLLSANESGFYLELVLRACSIYLIYLFFESLGSSNRIVLFIFLIGMIAIHMLYHLVKRVYVVHLKLPLTRYGEFLASRIEPMAFLIRLCSIGILQLSANTSLNWVQIKYTKGKSNAKDVFVRNANSFAALFVLTSVITFGTILCGFLIFKVGQEANQLMEGTLAMIDSHFSDELKERIQSVMFDSYSMGIRWMDGKISETWPNTNLTIIYDKFVQSYGAINQHPTPTFHNGQTGASQAPLNLVDVPFLQKLPQTSLVLSSVLAGNMSKLGDTALLLGSWAEMKNSSSYMISSMLHDGSSASKYFSSALTSTSMIILSFAVGISQFVLDFFGIVFQGIIFLVTLHALLSRETSVIEWFAQLLIHADPQQSFTLSLEENINAVLVCTFKLTLFHTLLTWFTFSIFGVELVRIHFGIANC
jgi:hypothetical protein